MSYGVIGNHQSSISVCLVASDSSKERKMDQKVLIQEVMKVFSWGTILPQKPRSISTKRLKKVIESVHVKVDEDIHKGRKNSITQTKELYVEYEDQSESEHLEETTSKNPNRYVQKNHPEEKIIGNKNQGVQTRTRLARNNEQVNFCLMTKMEPRTYVEANTSEKLMNAMQEELQQIEKNKTWDLVSRLADRNVIGTK